MRFFDAIVHDCRRRSAAEFGLAEGSAADFDLEEAVASTGAEAARSDGQLGPPDPEKARPRGGSGGDPRLPDEVGPLGSGDLARAKIHSVGQPDTTAGSFDLSEPARSPLLAADSQPNLAGASASPLRSGDSPAGTPSRPPAEASEASGPRDDPPATSQPAISGGRGSEVRDLYRSEPHSGTEAPAMVAAALPSASRQAQETRRSPSTPEPGRHGESRYGEIPVVRNDLSHPRRAVPFDVADSVTIGKKRSAASESAGLAAQPAPPPWPNEARAPAPPPVRPAPEPPRISIGLVEVVVSTPAAPPARYGAPIEATKPDLASRLYLRSL